MKQTLQLKFGQHLTMTPQLQQAIRLLQLSGIELQQEIQQALESNPMLELSEENTTSTHEDFNERQDAEPVVESRNLETDLQRSTLPEDLPVDSSWDDTYESYGSVSSMSSDQQAREFEVQGQTSENLQEHLLWQVQMAPFSPNDVAIAVSIIDAIDRDGYLSSSVEEILDGLGDEIEVELDEIEAVLHRIQNFDPPGVGARDLR